MMSQEQQISPKHSKADPKSCNHEGTSMYLDINYEDGAVGDIEFCIKCLAVTLLSKDGGKKKPCEHKGYYEVDTTNTNKGISSLGFCDDCFKVLWVGTSKEAGAIIAG
jgi:hypothetical protein